MEDLESIIVLDLKINGPDAPNFFVLIILSASGDAVPRKETPPPWTAIATLVILQRYLRIHVAFHSWTQAMIVNVREVVHFKINIPS